MTDTELLDPCEDKELMTYAFNNGATHIAIESGFPYKAINGESYFFKRHGSRLDKIASELDPEGVDSCDFLKIQRKGSIYENLDKMREHFLESFMPVVLYGPRSRGKGLVVDLLCKVDGISAVKSHELYAYDAQSSLNDILRKVIESTACHDACVGLVFATTDKGVARMLEPFMPVFYLDDDRSDIIKHV